MMKSTDLEAQLRKWREDRARKNSGGTAVHRPPRPVTNANDRRTVRVNGQEVVVITKPKRSAGVG